MIPTRTQTHQGVSKVTSKAPAAKLGVIPLLTARLAVSAPHRNRLPAPLLSEPMPKCVSVSLPPVAAGKVIDASLSATPLATDQPAVDRATLTRA